MKALRITFTQKGARAVCMMRNRETTCPEDSSWSGDREAFRLNDGEPISPCGSLELLATNVAQQAARCDASFEIEDLGDYAVRWTDEIILNESMNE